MGRPSRRRRRSSAVKEQISIEELGSPAGADVPIKTVENALSTALEKRDNLKKEITQIEKQIFDLEGTYLTETRSTGNVVVGWPKDNYPVYKGTGKSKAVPVTDEERVFSRSSVTAPLVLNRKEAEEKARKAKQERKILKKQQQAASGGNRSRKRRRSANPSTEAQEGQEESKEDGNVSDKANDRASEQAGVKYEGAREVPAEGSQSMHESEDGQDEARENDMAKGSSQSFNVGKKERQGEKEGDDDTPEIVEENAAQEIDRNPQASDSEHPQTSGKDAKAEDST